MNTLFKKNDVIPIKITGISHDGNGIGRYGDMVVFIPMSAPGDELFVRIVKVLSTRAYGIIEKITAPSPNRAENECPIFKRCGGCSLRHLSYECEIEVKESWARENLRRIGGIDVAFDPVMPSPKQEHYRNKAQYPVRRVNGEIRAGFFAKRSHELIPAEGCLLQPACFADIARAFTAFLTDYDIEPYDEAEHSGVVRHLYLRIAEASGELMVCIVVNANSLPFETELVQALLSSYQGIASIILNTNREKGNAILGDRERVLYGKPDIEDELCGVKLSLSAGSFYQVNRAAAQSLYEKALEYASPEPGDTLLDLYCGTGAIGLSMAGHVKSLIGVEVVESAVQDAQRNAVRNGIANARFIRADASDALKKHHLRPDIVLLDPPRKGADTATLESIAGMSPKKIVYISCDSATLARDCAILTRLGYRASKAVAADLFPRTAHVETIVLMTK